MDGTVQWDVDRVKRDFNEWRTANVYRPFKIYHFKLIFYLFLQIIEWGADIVMAIMLLQGDHPNTGTATSFFTIAPQIVVSILLICNDEKLKNADSVWKKLCYILCFPIRFVWYVLVDVFLVFFYFFLELILFIWETLMRGVSKEARMNRMPGQKKRQFIFFRGVFEFWFESLPQFIIRLVVALRGGVIKREILWCTTFVSAVNVLIHGIKVIRFRSESKLKIWTPAFHSVQEAQRIRKKKNLPPEKVSSKVTVTCSLKDFPWVDMYNDIYEEMTLTKVPSLGLTYFKHVCRLSSRTYALRKIVARDCEISDNGALSVSYLTEAMRNNNGMKEIDLSTNNLGNEGAGHIADMLRKNSTLEAINLSKNHIEVEGIRYIAGALRAHNTGLRCLTIDCNHIGKEGGESLGHLLRFNMSLEMISLVDCRLGNKGVEGLVCALPLEHGKLRHLDLDSNGIDHHGAEKLGRALVQNTHLESLKLANNAIGDEGLTQICAALNENYQMVDLNLTNTNITAKGALHLAAMLKINNMLQNLDLGNNNIGDHGVKLLVEALVLNKHLKKISLMRNNIAEDGIDAISKFIEEDMVVTDMDLSYNKINDAGAARVGQAVKVNKVLKVLNLIGNPISEEARKYVAESISGQGVVKVESDKDAEGNETIVAVDTLMFSRVPSVVDEGGNTQVQIDAAGLEPDPMPIEFYSQTTQSEQSLLASTRQKQGGAK